MAIVHPTSPRTPAPVPAQAIADIRAPFRKATLLPGMAYHDDAVYAWEREEIFFRDWIAVGRAEEIAGPGSFVLRDVLGEQLLLVRGKDDVIRAFYNVCRHRGTRGRGAGVRHGGPLPVPVPRLDLRPRRQARPGQAHRGPRGLQLRDVRAPGDPLRGVGGVHLPVLRRRGRHAAAARVHGRLVRAPRELRPGHVAADARGAALVRRRRRTGRSWPRTTASATTARRSTRCSTGSRPTTWARTSWPRVRGRVAGCRSPRAARRCRSAAHATAARCSTPATRPRSGGSTTTSCGRTSSCRSIRTTC